MNMNTTLKYIALSMSAALLAACSPDYITPDQAKLPQAADFDVKVEVNQETNYVTFNMSNSGVVPVWIIGAADPIDNTNGSKVTGKNYAYTGNGLSLRFRDEGKHTVEVKAYNAHGISVGSQMVEFNLNNTYRDPFDPAPYIKALSDGSTKTWEWNHTVAGHFGCGPFGGNGTEWWSAGVDEKKDWSLYDDKITFGADGSYIYDPGDGQIFVNANSGVKSELATGEDYLVPWEKTTATYSVESNWNDAGVEEIYITLPKGTPMSYIADQTELDDPRYLVLENKPADMKKCLKLVANLKTSGNPDGIAWHYEFVKEGSAGGEVDGPDIFDVDGPGNLWNGASVSMTYWYSESDWSGKLTPETESLANNGIKVVIPEGIGGSEWMGQTAFHTDIPMSAAKTYDFCVTVESDQDIPAMTFKLAWEGNDNDHSAIYVNDFAVDGGEPTTFKMEAVAPDVDYDKALLIIDLGRCAAGSTVSLTKICLQEHK